MGIVGLGLNGFQAGIGFDVVDPLGTDSRQGQIGNRRFARGHQSLPSLRQTGNVSVQGRDDAGGRFCAIRRQHDRSGP